MESLDSITLNGTKQAWTQGQTLRDLCDQLQVGTRGYAVECNGAIVPRSQLDQTAVQPGDVIEIVHMVGGGV